MQPSEHVIKIILVFGKFSNTELKIVYNHDSFLESVN